MDCIGKRKNKEYKSLDNSQNNKNLYYEKIEKEEESTHRPDRLKLYLLIGGILFLVLVIFFVAVINIYNSEKKSKQQTDVNEKIDNQQFQNIQRNEPNQPNLLNQANQANQRNINIQNNQNSQKNQQNQTIPQNKSLNFNEQNYKVYEIKKPLNLTKSKYLKFFPSSSLKEKGDLSNIENIFKSKVIYINDQDITYDYIRYIHQKDQDEEIYKHILYPSTEIDSFSMEQRLDRKNITEFYNICNKKKLDSYNNIIVPTNPAISIIIPIYINYNGIIRTLRSIQNQSFKNIEIIIVDDIDSNDKKLCKSLFEKEPHLRIFTQIKNLGMWRKRLDGFLYSKGKYILHINSGDILSDNYILEDIYNLVTKYSLDTIRFSFFKVNFHNNSKEIKFTKKKIYPKEYLTITYGRPNYNIHEFGYGTIFNRLVRNNIFTKGLDLVDEYIINSYKDFWEDIWWNDLIDRVSFSNVIINRVGYVYLYDKKKSIEAKVNIQNEKDKTIKEIIYIWFFDYQLLPKENNKKILIETLHNYTRINNTFNNFPIRLDNLITKFTIYERLLLLLLNDPAVLGRDKLFIQELYINYMYNTTLKSHY